MKRLAISSLPVWVLLSCDPGITVSGTVLGEDTRPVADARVDLECERSGYELALGFPLRTQEDGSFRTNGIGCLPKRCKIIVKGRGHRSAVASVAEGCSNHHWYCNESNCNQVDVVLRLRVEAGGAR